jgi:hypothetical protein
VAGAALQTKGERMNTRHFALRLTGGLLVCSLLVCVTLRHRQIRALQDQPFGRFTNQQIVERTLPLCQAILGHADGLMLSTQRMHTNTLDSSSHLWWHIECVDSDHKPLAGFLWNAETGELAFTSRDNGMSPTPESPSAHMPSGSMTPEQAKGRAAWLSYRWLSRLGMSEGRIHWRLTQEPEHSVRCGDVWSTRWRSSDHVASVQVNVRSSELVSAQNRPLAAPRSDTFLKQ